MKHILLSAPLRVYAVTLLTFLLVVLRADAQWTLQILHGSDFEGGVNASTDAPNFAAIVDALEDTYTNSITLASGDNWIPSPFSLSGEDPSLVQPLKDAYISYYGSNFANNDLRAGIARPDISIMNFIGVEASVLGNHEFDLGTPELRNMIAGLNSGAAIRWFGAQFPYLSCNLDFSADVSLSNIYEATAQPDGFFRSNPTMTGSQIANTKKLAPYTLIEENGETIGVIGVTTPILAAISSPGATTVLNPGAGTDNMALLASIVQPRVNELINNFGVNKVILLAHLQQLNLEKQLAQLLSGVDVIIAGGSHTLMADAQDRMRAGDVPAETYPFFTTGLDGHPVVIINTTSEYRYVGRLVIDFNASGQIVPSSVDPNVSGAFAADTEGVEDLYPTYASAFVAGTRGYRVQLLTSAIQNVIIAKDGNTFGKTDVYLQGLRNFVRTQETNLGNITADANLWQARQVIPQVQVSLKNGGGIRSAMGVVNAVGDQVEYLPPAANPIAGKEEGEISQLDIENSLRFNNRLSVLDVTAAGLKTLLEHGVAASGAGLTPGRFPQVGGMRFSYDLTFPANSRIRNAAIVDESGAVIDSIVFNGSVYGNPGRIIKVVTLNFLAGGGDSYPFTAVGSNRIDLDTLNALEFTPGSATFAIPGSEQDAFAEFIQAFYALTPFNVQETSKALDYRIQDLSSRQDRVYPIAGEFASNAVPAAATAFPGCGGVSDNLANFSPSEFALTTAVTGEDKWYTLLASTNGARFAVTAGTNDIIIEVQDAAGNLVAAVNDIDGAGDEVLTTEDLVPGQVYRIGIRNYNSAGGIGTFTLCSAFFNASTCDYGPGPYSLCSTFKADFVSAGAYRFDFTSTTTLETVSQTRTGSTFLTLSTVPGLTWGDNYDVEITAIYYTPNAEGEQDTTEVSTLVPCGLITAAQPLAALRVTDRCSNGPRFIGATVAAVPFICTAIDYKWTFTRTDVPELPITHFRGSANRFLSLNVVTGLVQGATYEVTITPVFAYGEGLAGPAHCLSIVGPGLYNTSPTPTQTAAVARLEESEQESLNLFPNPNDGSFFNLQLEETEAEVVWLRILDTAGKTVFSQQYAMPENKLLQVAPMQNLSDGLYMVHLTEGARTHVLRMMIEN